MEDSYYRILELFQLENDPDANNIYLYVKDVYPEPTEDSSRIMIEILRLRFGSPSNINLILREFCPSDSEVIEERKNTTNRISSFIKKIFSKDRTE